MRQSHSPLGHKHSLAALVSVFLASASPMAAAERDPHRPACRDDQCRKMESYLRAHYCGESPYGDGPPSGCKIAVPPGPRPGVEVLADFGCDWSDLKQQMECKQHRE